jgi:hypothetical protein
MPEIALKTNSNRNRDGTHVPTRVDKSTDDFTFVIAAESYGVSDEGDIVGFFSDGTKVHGFVNFFHAVGPE